VARAYLELPPEDVVEATFDPYDRKWDGIVPLEDDPGSSADSHVKIARLDQPE
jgi:hypothetical protein